MGKRQWHEVISGDCLSCSSSDINSNSQKKKKRRAKPHQRNQKEEKGEKGQTRFRRNVALICSRFLLVCVRVCAGGILSVTHYLFLVVLYFLFARLVFFFLCTMDVRVFV
jgi:Flp pilus assembly protein TadB